MAARPISSGGASESSPRRSSGERGLVIASRYELQREIGSGGMATVWEANHLTLGRSVAIKLLDVAGPQSERLTERFLREAKVLAAIRHRNVVDIIDFGTTEQGRPYMAMELLVGEPLSNVVQRDEALSVGEVVRIMARVLSGLGAAHDKGIVHRDLKPENVFIVRDADGTYPKLLDFGVSRALDPGSGVESVMPTTENAIVGTPQYMSPEQARGLKNVDHRSDLWSAGVILFELLAGVLPYEAEAVGDIIIKIATEDPPDLCALRPDLEGPITEVVKTAMRRTPEDRFQTAREMRAMLLAAAARTAEHLEAGSGVHPKTDKRSDMPPPGADDLLSAISEAYEPGDSELIDFSEHLGGLDAVEASRPAPLPNLPPPAPRVSLDPFAPEPRRRRWPWVLALTVLVLAGLGAAAYFMVPGLIEPAPAASHEALLPGPEVAPATLEAESQPEPEPSPPAVEPEF